MKKNKFALQIISFALIVLSFIACDKDFATLDSDVINEDNATNFNISSETYDIITHTKPLGPVQTNNLGLNTLGIFDDIYGRTTSQLLTQLTTSSFDPDFGEEIEIDSVVLTLPFFNRVIDVDEDSNVTYELDSVIGNDPMNLRIFRSNYIIRNFDPNGAFSDTQSYFSNKSASETETISEAILEGEELTFVEYDEISESLVPINNTVLINNEGYILTEPDNDEDEDEDPQVLFRQPPGIRVLLEPTFWKDNIIDQAGTTALSSNNNFAEYFRGLYFKITPEADSGSFLILNVGAQNSNITIYYTRLTTLTTDAEDLREEAIYTFNFGQNRVNFFENDFTLPLDEGDEINGDERIYLKGGEGSLANIKLFNGEDLDEDDDTVNTFETWKNDFVETDTDGKFVKAKRLVNEANLVFYVDQDFIETLNAGELEEPNRLFLYDVDNKSPLVDYFLDGLNNSIPSFSIINHLGTLQRVDDEPNGKGIKYKMKITEHINNLLLRDSTNVNLGLSLTINVNLEEFLAQREVLLNGPDVTTPVSSIISPRGTVLHGNNTGDESKKVYLEIYYTEENN
ncbi:DUF4270 domain-containing protein [Winogradskyella sp. UBA3174]|uniref:DUF4270 domain-containing protein n=1 Tax=Winogradskyella sp. UBA3174 TaxID=1947785 RepID=UPI0025ECCC4C|nr:DUF4270 domain-containing protein [Winogradskyella sp. UBA3174]|tara:strand:+ start:19682 stop:21391 length:1710 start_codon:yes stop_codon:yes gene_type:complete